jgi:DNA modification methylase
MHFATFPLKLIKPCIIAGSPEGGTVLDPFGGSGTTGLMAARLNCNAALIEMSPEFVKMAKKRLENNLGMFADVEVVKP